MEVVDVGIKEIERRAWLVAEVVSPQDKYVVSLGGAELLFEEFKPLIGL